MRQITSGAEFAPDKWRPITYQLAAQQLESGHLPSFPAESHDGARSSSVEAWRMPQVGYCWLNSTTNPFFPTIAAYPFPPGTINVIQMPSGLRRSADNQTRRSSSHFILPHPPLSSPLQMSLLAVLGVCCCLRAKKNCTRREGDALLHPYFTTGPGVQPEAELIGRRSGRHFEDGHDSLKNILRVLDSLRCLSLLQSRPRFQPHD